MKNKRERKTMEILYINADQKVANIASSIGQNPLSWQGWHCLHIQLTDISDELKQDSFLWAKSIVESYLHNAEGRVYFCDHDIHVICKNVPNNIVQQAGEQIIELVYNESNITPAYELYDLGQHGFTYAQNVFKQNSNIFSMPVTDCEELEDVSFKNFIKPAQHDKKIQTLNPDGFIRVLLAEDDPVTRWMVRNALKNECEFATAPVASKVYSMYSAYQPDVVFLDIDLPDGNGFTVLEWIMRNDPGAYVVMFSSNDDLDNISNAIEQGARGFVAKPFLKENLLHYVRSYAGQA